MCYENIEMIFLLNDVWGYLFHSHFFFWLTFFGRNVIHMVRSRNGVFTRGVMTLLVFLPLFFPSSQALQLGAFISVWRCSQAVRKRHISPLLHTHTAQAFKTLPGPPRSRAIPNITTAPLTLLRSDLMGRQAQEEAPRYRCPRSLVFQCVFSRLIPGKWRGRVPG